VVLDAEVENPPVFMTFGLAPLGGWVKRPRRGFMSATPEAWAASFRGTSTAERGLVLPECWNVKAIPAGVMRTAEMT
jgi:hypothetical protein